MNLIKSKIYVVFLFSAGLLFGQSLKIDKIEPPNWWAGMKTNNIQLMVYGKNLLGYKAAFDTKNIKVTKSYTAENSDYTFIDISITKNIKPGIYKLSLKRGKDAAEINFPVLDRDKEKNIHRGFNVDDIVYLIMPDRFSDGDTLNNVVPGLINDFKPGDPLGRHGGDLQGIMDHFDYFNELGITSLWLTPVLENNMPVSYHGYAATDLYKLDPRLGNNELYKKFVNGAHKKGIKVIYDHVSNHIGINHPWVKDPPFKDWLNGSAENHLNAWHDKMVFTDIHGAELTLDHLTKGWFVDDMADMNQRNEFLKKYLIQNTIWWIEYSGIDGIREDTYPYVFPEFLSDWAKQILIEYPHFNIVGEVWTGETAYLAPFQKDSKLNQALNTNLPVVTDFALQNAYEKYLKGESNLYSIFDVLAKDYLYENSNDLLVFADNHDIPRAMFHANGDSAKVKLVFAHMLTARGIPQILYGTEIGIVGNQEHGYLRENFRGGFPNVQGTAFTPEGRTEKENDLFSFFQKLIGIRKKYTSLSDGTLKHLAPVDNVYMYTKQNKSEMMLVVLNGDNTGKEIDMNIVESLCGGKPKLYDVWNQKYVPFENKLNLEPMSFNLYSVEK